MASPVESIEEAYDLCNLVSDNNADISVTNQLSCIWQKSFAHVNISKIFQKFNFYEI